MRNYILAGIASVFASFGAYAQSGSDLAQLFAEDQAARRPAPGKEIDWATVNKEDAERRAAVMSLLRAGGVKTAQDYYFAAMVFQHGDSEEDIRLAHAFATVASALGGESSAANWLKAASWDRLMLRFDQPQWYGTQYVKDASGKWVLYKVEANVVTDAQRAAWSVPPLAESESRAATMNGGR